MWAKAQTDMIQNARLIEKGANNEWTVPSELHRPGHRSSSPLSPWEHREPDYLYDGDCRQHLAQARCHHRFE